MLSLPFGVGKNSSWSVCICGCRARARERERVSEKRKSLSESYESLFSFFVPYCVFSAKTHPRTRVSLEGLFFFFKRCNFDAIVYFAVSLDVRGKKRVLDYSFLFLLLLLLFGFRFRDERMEGSNKELLLCC